jgi:Tat protein secretion system quality control protein TatD with DNase activity
MFLIFSNGPVVRMIRLIDTHTHLEEIQDFDESIERAEKSGVSAIIAVGMNYESN